MSATYFSLRGKRIVVTGGTRGIGAAISSHLARAGADVLAGYARNDEAADALTAELREDGLTLQTCRADLGTDVGIGRLLNTIGDRPLAAFVHCAATGVHRPIGELTLRHWDFTFALNLRAFFALTTGLLPRFVAGSTIVALSSQGAVQALPQYTLVGATKGGLEALCRHLAVELAPRGIRINVLSPGSVLTQAWDAFPNRDERLRQAAERAPCGRLVTLEEIARAAHFLCSDASVGINGHTLVVDGGERIRG